MSTEKQKKKNQKNKRKKAKNQWIIFFPFDSMFKITKNWKNILLFKKMNKVEFKII